MRGGKESGVGSRFSNWAGAQFENRDPTPPSSLSVAPDYAPQLLWKHAGLFRDAAGLRLALKQLGLTLLAAATFDVRPTTFATAAAASAVAEVGVCLLIGATLGPIFAERMQDQVPRRVDIGEITLALILVIAVIAVVRFGITLYRHRRQVSKD